MTSRQDPIAATAKRPLDGECPHPVSLETLAVVEDALADLLWSLRGTTRRAAEEAGAVEYASWLARDR